MTMATRFTAPDGKIFVVEEVRQVDREQWVHYHDAKTGRKYSCLLDAFTQRFQPLVNESRVSGH